MAETDPRIRRIAAGFRFLEAPRWHDGRLYFSDFYTHLVHTIDASEHIEVMCTVPGQPSGLGFLPDGRLLVVSMLDKRLMVVEGDHLVELADLSSYFGGPANDLIVDAAGRAYVGNFGSDTHRGAPEVATVLVRVDPNGSTRVAAEDLAFPNGMAFTPDRRTLLVAESLKTRITAFDHDARTGELSDRRVWAQLEPEPPEATYAAALAGGSVMPDGICIDAEGCVWIADSGGHAVVRISEGGEVLDTISCGDMTAYAVALGGADLRSLYICAGPKFASYDPETEVRGELWVAEVDVPGTGS